MASRRHTCDVPGCERQRARWQRLCETCWATLPGDIRHAIVQHYRSGDRAEHRAWCRRAREHFAAELARAEDRCRRAFEQSERIAP